jgi:hypothetical protein
MDTKKKLTQKELLEVSDNISKYYAPKYLRLEVKLVVLPVDSQHLHVYWQLPEDKPQSVTVPPSSSDKLMLRIHSVHTQTHETKPIVEFAIGEQQTKQKIKLPVTNKGAVYSVSIGKIIPKYGFVQLIKSNITHSLSRGARWNRHNEGVLDNDRKKQFKFVPDVIPEKKLSIESGHFLMSNHSGLGIMQ